MMGVRFRGHPDLRRILMWEGYPYFPLRKDFPLAGKPTDVPEVAFTRPAPLEGGPFVTMAGGKDTIAREPRGRTVGELIHDRKLFDELLELPPGFGLRQPFRLRGATAAGALETSTLPGKAPEGWRSPGRWRDGIEPCLKSGK